MFTLLCKWTGRGLVSWYGGGSGQAVKGMANRAHDFDVVTPEKGTTIKR